MQVESEILGLSRRQTESLRALSKASSSYSDISNVLKREVKKIKAVRTGIGEVEEEEKEEEGERGLKQDAEQEKERSEKFSMEDFYTGFCKAEEKAAEENRALIEKDWKWLEDAWVSSQSLQSLSEEVKEGISVLSQHKDSILLETHGLHNACHSLLLQKNKAQSSLQTIEEHLSHYKKLDGLKARIQQKENAAFSSLAAGGRGSGAEAIFSSAVNGGGGEEGDRPKGIGGGDDLKVMLDKVDESVEFFTVHKNYFNSERYLAQYKSLRTNLLSSLSAVVMHTLTRCETQAVNCQAAINPSLHYAKFRSAAMQLKPFTTLLKQKAEGGPTDPTYSQVMGDLEKAYVECRRRVVSTPVRSQLQTILDRHGTLSPANRQATTFILSVCQLELNTYQSFFPISRTTDWLSDLMDNLGGIYYDLMRPAVLACDDMEELREISDCLILDILEPQANAPSSAHLISLLAILYKLHADVQERLIFRTETFLRDEITCFQPTPYLLDYPNRLFDSAKVRVEGNECAGEGNQDSSTNKTSEADGSISTFVNNYNNINNTVENSNYDMSLVRRDAPGVYPIISLVGKCLGIIYNKVDRVIFEDIAQRAVKETILNIIQASKLIEQQKGNSFDAQLFLIKHLLLLRDTVCIYNCEMVHEERVLNFSKIRSKLWEFISSFSPPSEEEEEGREAGGIAFPPPNANGIQPAALSPSPSVSPPPPPSPSSNTGFVGMLELLVPELTFTRVSGKEDLDRCANHSCELLVAHHSAMIILPLIRLTSNIEEAKKAFTASNPPNTNITEYLSSQSFLTLEQLSRTFDEFDRNLRVQLPRMVMYLKLYLVGLGEEDGRDWGGGGGEIEKGQKGEGVEARQNRAHGGDDSLELGFIDSRDTVSIIYKPVANSIVEHARVIDDFLSRELHVPSEVTRVSFHWPSMGVIIRHVRECLERVGPRRTPKLGSGGRIVESWEKYEGKLSVGDNEVMQGEPLYMQTYNEEEDIGQKREEETEEDRR